MKTPNYESLATNVVKRLNEKFGEKAGNWIKIITKIQ